MIFPILPQDLNRSRRSIYHEPTIEYSCHSARALCCAAFALAPVTAARPSKDEYCVSNGSDGHAPRPWSSARRRPPESAVLRPQSSVTTPSNAHAKRRRPAASPESSTFASSTAAPIRGRAIDPRVICRWGVPRATETDRTRCSSDPPPAGIIAVTLRSARQLAETWLNDQGRRLAVEGGDGADLQSMQHPVPVLIGGDAGDRGAGPATHRRRYSVASRRRSAVKAEIGSSAT